MTPLDLHDASSSDTLQLLVGGGQGEPEMLLLIERPQAGGVVRVRSWSSDDWTAAPTTSERQTADLLADVERWARQRRGLNHSLSAVRQWLLR
ncbi:MAG TPA: hypothetical protein VJW73_09710 [Gemmatimonadaceae bacterium]|nr:hypothetical protein [Gemmatimonadaceae bacterium]